MTVVGVVADPRIAAAAAGAVALRLSSKGAVGMVTLDLGGLEGQRPPAPPPTLDAARKAARLRSLGHPARSSWRLVRCDAVDLSEAVSAARHLEADGSTVVLAMTQCDVAADALDVCDAVLPAADGEVGSFTSTLAAEELASRCDRSAALELDSAGISTVLALAGIASPPQWTAAIDRALSSLGLIEPGPDLDEATPGDE
jgi:hypothetical protein